MDSSNRQDYTVLFEKASAKLGLIPIDQEIEVEVENPETGEKELQTITQQWRMVPAGNGQWTKELLDPEHKEADAEFLATAKGISSLNEYFQHIEDLAALAIGNGRTGSDPYFLRIPLDEPFFEINANTRAISVPSELRQVGVVGDKYAEIVFFKIDRYFDAVDLDTRQIYIEWEAPGANGETIKGISRDFLRDTQSEKDKIIFGWIIGDELTQAVGTIRFAVRFVEWNSSVVKDPETGEWISRETDDDTAVAGTELAYSFSSLPAQITVVDSLHYDLFENSEEAEMIKTDEQAGTILFFLQNSDSDVADETAPEPAGIPVFIRNLPEGSADLEDNKLRLTVEAVSTEDSGIISYMFGRKEQPNSGTQAIVARIDFIEVGGTSGTDPKEDATLYIKRSNGIYEVASADDIASGEQLYEKVAYIIATEPGYYFAKARNSVSNLKTSSAISNMLYIPYAAIPSVGDNEADKMPERFVIKEKTYTERVDKTIDQTHAPGSWSSNIMIDVSAEGPDTITIGGPDHGPHFSVADNKSDYLEYTLWKADNEEMEGAEIVSKAQSSNFEISEPGFYAISVRNHFNNNDATAEKEVAGILRVTNMPKVPTVLFDAWSATVEAGRPSAAIEVEETEHDEITYEWHRVTGANDDKDIVAEGYMESASGKVTFENGIGTIPFLPLAEGFYYFILKNELNGAMAEWNSALDPNCGTIYVTTNPVPVIPGVGHTVSYRWAEGTPEAITVEAPATATNVVDGTLVRPKEYADVEVEGGKYVLTWEPNSATIAGEDVEFVGTWTFVANEAPVVEPTKYHVSYVWGAVEGTLPETGMPEVPIDSNEYEAEDVVTLAEAPTDVVTVEGGSWSFNAWDPAEVTIADSDVVITGKWAFTAATEEPEENPEDNPDNPNTGE